MTESYFEIKEGVTPPSPRHAQTVGASISHAIRQLKVGQCFDTPAHLRKHLSYYSWEFRRLHPFVQHVTKTVVENGEKVVRCWRLADATPEQVQRPQGGLTAALKQEIALLELQREVFVYGIDLDVVVQYLKENTAHEWGARTAARQIQRKRVSGFFIFRKT